MPCDNCKSLETQLAARTKDEIQALIERYGDPNYKTNEFALYDVISVAQQLQSQLAEKEREVGKLHQEKWCNTDDLVKAISVMRTELEGLANIANLIRDRGKYRKASTDFLHDKLTLEQQLTASKEEVGSLKTTALFFSTEKYLLKKKLTTQQATIKALRSACENFAKFADTDIAILLPDGWLGEIRHHAFKIKQALKVESEGK